MKNFSITLSLLCAIFIHSALAQNERLTALQDSTLHLLRMNESPPVLDKPIAILPLAFVLTAPETNSQFSLYQTFAGTPQSFAWNRDTKIDLTAPLKLQMYQSESEKAFRITLGAAQTAGAAYLAYRYLKKYGLK